MFNRLVMIGILAGMTLITAACGAKPASTETKTATNEPKQVATAPVVEEQKPEVKETVPPAKETPKAVQFKIAEDKKNEKQNGRYIRVTTDSTSESDFKDIINQVKADSKAYDAVWLYIHDTSASPFGKNIATVRFPITQKGIALVGAKNKDDVIMESKSVTGAKTPAEPKKQDNPAPAVANKGWESDVDEIAKSKKTETEKFDEISKLARIYQPSQQELKDFESIIIAEFKNGKYLKDVKNHKYMLSNVFRSTVVERQYDDKEKQPIDAFALDFLQNTKNTYRGEAVSSASVKSNEEQMKKTLAQIK
jgi:hypothetical protein